MMTTLDGMDQGGTDQGGTDPGGTGKGAVLDEAMRELEAAIHDARVAFDCVGLGELDRAHTSAVTARIAIDAAMTAIQAALGQR